ncbi:cytochrome c biogenesis protein ResB [Myceligenerans pegani]|uniref:Cytochrome c biogenesis protein ResB n=1 Tax=Myceligenerans pegani TaxID=2776917 RepID=A0ABR9N4M4_9MICO|nr:cytochrome c biogenesis protein ResB [Myceligenerans sp. TRM 65318]MBE1878622.1 cytochrome c biogenesis protein ResB [Myceligenerans sp. TRM 65318]MBE3020893.1 cytochrome c biogenesis protein ResB [Myceligenerans sp. TRM 65318]
MADDAKPDAGVPGSPGRSRTGHSRPEDREPAEAAGPAAGPPRRPSAPARTHGSRSRGRYVPHGIDDEFAEDAGTAGPSSAGGDEDGRRPAAPGIGVVGMLRWTWRQLTSMRVALMLLMLLAVAAVPGSVLPQRGQDPGAVAEYLGDHPDLGEWLDRLGFFDVYTSVWFSAIYLLLFVSLVGCIVPRTGAHWRALRARPPRVPSRFARFPARASLATDLSPDDVVGLVATKLRGPRHLPTFRVDRRTEPARAGRPEAHTVSAERGYLRETGNLLFHLALLGLLVSVAMGQMLHYRGQAIVTEGRGFANAVVDYDTFDKGSWFQASSLVPFSMTLDAFDSEFASETVAFAQARDFTAHVTVTEPDGTRRAEQIKVNHPLVTDGAKIYLQGNGFAPEITVTDAAGEVAFSQRVPFLPEDQMYTSRGVVKVPDVSGGDQIGLIGYFLPTAVVDEDGAARSTFPQPLDPLLVLEVYRGDLGLDEGVPRNVYQLDTASLTPSVDEAGERVKLLVRPGETVDLPDGLGTVTLGAEVPRYVALDLRHDPSLGFVLTFALLALGGLALSLFTPRRRVWVRAFVSDSGATVVEAAGLARGDDTGLQGEVDRAMSVLPVATPENETTKD